MLRDEAVDIINQRLQRNETTLTVAALQQAQILLESGDFDPWFLQTQSDSLTTEVGVRKVALPVNFMREIDGDPLLYVDGDSIEKEVAKIDPWRSLPREGQVGPPKSYYLRGTELIILPTPDAVYNLTLPYIQKAQTLIANIENLWLAHGPFWLIGVAGAMRAMSVRDTESLNWFTEMGAVGKQTVEQVTSARLHSNRVYEFGGPI